MKITQPLFNEREIELLRDCLLSGWVTQGPKTSQFERAFADFHAVPHALATTSCTAALHLAALALELAPGDEVIIPAFTWITSANCAEYVGARAVFADIDPDTYNIDPAAFERAITDRTKALVAVHLFGLAANMDEIAAIARQRNIAIIEDAACAIGTTYKGRPVGGLGDLGCFSFHPRKVITTGEGGMVTVKDQALAERVNALRNHGATPADEPNHPWSMNRFEVLGYDLRLSDVQAAVGLAQMEKLDALLQERRARGRRYSELLADVSNLVLPLAGDTDGHSYQSYVVRLREGGSQRRNAVMTHLEKKGIQTRPGTHAVHNLGYYRNKYGHAPEDFPVASMAEATTITLPLFPMMSDADQERVVSELRTALAR